MTREATQEGVSEQGGFSNNRLSTINSIAKERAAEREEEDGEDAEALALLREQAEQLDDDLGRYDDDGNERGEEDDNDPGTGGQGEEDDTGDPDPDDPHAEDDDPENDEDPENKKPDDPADPDDKESESPVFMQDGQWMTRIKVDGEIKTVPYAKLQAAVQKMDAGDKRLEEANRLMREVQQREQTLLNGRKGAEQEKQPPAQGAEGQSQTENGKPNQETLDLINQYHEALLNGEDASVTNELLAKLATAGGKQPEVDVDSLVNKVADRVTQQQADRDKTAAEAKRKEDMKSAYSAFSKKFKDIVDDPQLTEVADRLTITVAQEHPTYSPLEVMEEAGRRTRKWLADKTGKKSDPANEDPNRRERKRNMKTAKGNAARKTGKPPERPKTRTDTLNELRAARGQAPLG